MRKITLNTLLTRSLLVRCAFIIALIVSTNSALAQQFGTTSSYLQTTQIQSAQTAEASYDAYQSTIYTPFSNETPGTVGTGNGDSDSYGITNRKNGFNQPSEEGGSNESPLGDAWSLLIFAAIGAGVIFIKQRKNLKAKA